MSVFCREFAGFTGLVFKAIRGRDGFTRDFGRGRYENLSGAISWLICFQRKPSSFRCSAQPAGSRGVIREGLDIPIIGVAKAGWSLELNEAKRPLYYLARNYASVSLRGHKF